MGRPRKHDKHLPRRMRFRHGAYRFRGADGREITLAKSYSEALRKYAELIEPGGTLRTFGDVGALYLRERLPKLRPATQRAYCPAIAKLCAVFGRMAPATIRPAMIYQYRSLRPPVYGNREVGVLSVLMAFAIECGLCDRNPCREVRRTSERPRTRYVTDAEFLSVLSLASEPVRLAMDLAVLTGLRIGDLLRLRLDAVQADGLHLAASKTGKRIVLEWTAELTRAVAAAKAYSGTGSVRAMTLIVNQRGHPYTSDGFRAVWTRLQARAIATGAIAERFRFHDLRAKATERAENPQELLGHDNPAITSRVYRRNPRRVKPSAGIWDICHTKGQP